LYSVDVLFTIGTTESQVIRETERRLKRPLTTEERDAFRFSGNGKSIHLLNGACVLWLRAKSLSVLAHEIFHVATFILDRAGIKLTDSSDEAYAYLIEHLTRQALNKTGMP
jgi:hypothetical protein